MEERIFVLFLYKNNECAFKYFATAATPQYHGRAAAVSARNLVFKQAHTVYKNALNKCAFK